MSLQFQGCFHPTTGFGYVLAQDAIIAFGKVAQRPAFYNIRTWNTNLIIVQERNVILQLLKLGPGTDRFSLYEAVVKGLEILWQCIITQHQPMGGSNGIGQMNIFRVVLKATHAAVS
ncbi:MAG: hypothetical protein Q9224_002871 [Gallowayella concinna]